MPKNLTTVFVRHMKIDALLGICPGEIGVKQRVVVSVEAILADPEIAEDKIESTVSYTPIIEEIHRMSGIQFSLAEKFAEHLAEFCLGEKRIDSVKVRVEKPDIFPNAIVGAEIIRSR